MTYTGQLPGYLVEQSHSAIIDLVTFELVQAGIARRKHIGLFKTSAGFYTHEILGLKTCGCSHFFSIVLRVDCVVSLCSN